MPKCEPVGLDFIERARVVSKVTVRVAASPERVWHVLTDTDRWPDWFEGMKTCRSTSELSTGVGSTRFVHVDLLRAHERIEVWEPNIQWGFCVRHLNFGGWIAKRMLEVVNIEPDGSGSTLSYTGAFDPVLWLRPLGGVLKKKLASVWETSLARIDQVS